MASFEADDGRQAYVFEFVGYSDDSLLVQVDLPSGPRSLSADHVRFVRFDSKARTAEVRFLRMDEFSLPSSFVLRISGTRGIIDTGRKRIAGTASWDW